MASFSLVWTGSTSDVIAQTETQLEEISVAGSVGRFGKAGEGVGLQRDLPPPYAGGQFARGGSLGILGTRDALNTPFSTTNFTQQVIQDQQARTAADTLVNDASVRLTTAGNGFSDEFVIRGFPVQAQDIGLNGLYGLVSSNRVAAQYIERIELLKGPGAFMYGIPPGGSVGGSINIVTKRALDLPFVQVTPQFISAGNFGLHLDASTRAGENKEWGIRFNGLARTGEASINDGNWQTGLGALSLDYQGERLRWALDVITQNDDTKNFRPQVNFLQDIPFIPRPPDARSNWFPGTLLNQRDNTVATFLEYDLTDWLTAYGGIGYRAGSNNQTFPDSRVGNSLGVDALGNFRLINAYYDSYSKSISGNAGLRARFDTGFVNHSMNFVFTGFGREDGYAYVSNSVDESVPSNIYNPSPLPVVNGARLAPQRYANTRLTSVALADTMSILDDTVLLTAGVRYQMVKQSSYDPTTQARSSLDYDADAVSPLAGIVFKPWKNVSLYANYAEGLSSGSIVAPNYFNGGAILAPYKSDQQEIGIKVDWGTITTTAALFQISRPELAEIRQIVGDKEQISLGYNGEQRNRGLELSAYGAILPSLRGFASVTFLRPELTKPLNPLQRGNDAAGVPDLTASAGLEWDTPWVPGLALNGRVLYTSGSYLTSANTVRFPDWTRFDLGLRYATLVYDRPTVFRFNVENVADNRYWLTTGTFVTVASPRTFIASASFTF